MKLKALTIALLAFPLVGFGSGSDHNNSLFSLNQRLTSDQSMSQSQSNSVDSAQFTRQKQNSKQSAIGSGNVTTYQNKESARTAYAPGGVLGKCLAAYGIGIQGRGFGISIGGNKARKKCEARELAILLIENGNTVLGQKILQTQYADWLRAQKPKFICKLPVKKNCYQITADN